MRGNTVMQNTDASSYIVEGLSTGVKRGDIFLVNSIATFSLPLAVSCFSLVAKWCLQDRDRTAAEGTGRVGNKCSRFIRGGE